jgi:hypothetical protein
MFVISFIGIEHIWGMSLMFTVQYKSKGNQAWHTLGSYGSEQSAMSNAERLIGKYGFIRILDPSKNVIWSG